MRTFFDADRFVELYYVEKNHALQYANNPPGTLDVVRLVQGHPRHWQKPTAATVLKKKTLIFADWWAIHWSPSQLHEVQLLLSDLMRAGFIIYYWQPHGLMRLHDVCALEDVSLRKQITPEYKPMLLTAAMQQHRLTADQVLILYRYQLMKLLEYPEDWLFGIEHVRLKSLTQGNLARLQAVDESEPSTAIQWLIVDDSNDMSNPQRLWPTMVRKKSELMPDVSPNFSVTVAPQIPLPAPLKSDLSELVDCMQTLSSANAMEPFSWSKLPKLVLSKSRHYLDTGSGMLTDFSASQCIDWIQFDAANDHALTQVFFDYLRQHAMNVTRLHLQHVCLDKKINMACLKQPLQSLALESVHIKLSCLKQLLPGCKHLYMKSTSVSLEEDGCVLDDVFYDNLDLVSLSIDIDTYASTQESTQESMKYFTDLLKHASHLSELHVYGLSISHLCELESPDLEVLTELHLEDESDIELCHALNKYPLLRDVSIFFANYVCFNNQLIAALNRIETVTLGFNYADYDEPDAFYSSRDECAGSDTEDDVCYFDGELTSLTRLNVWTLGEYWDDNEKQHMKSLLRASVKLKFLSITADSDYKFEWLNAVSLPESIEWLHVTSYGIAFDTLFRTIKALPHLKSLIFEYKEIDPHCPYCNDDTEQQRWREGKSSPEFKALMQRLEYVSLPDEYDYRVETPWVFCVLRANKRKREEASSNEGSDNDVGLTAPKPQETCVDFDTAFTETTFELTRVFYSMKTPHHPDPGEYRLMSYNHLSFTSSEADEPFQLMNQGDLDLTDDEEYAPQRLVDSCEVMAWTQERGIDYYGKEVLVLNTEWQPIASLSARDKMHGIKWIPPYSDVEVRYSRRDNLYYLRRTNNTQSEAVTVEFALSVQPLVDWVPALPNAVANMIKYLNTFGAGELTFKSEVRTLGSYVNAILKQRVGACRHRVVVFKAWMLHTHPGIPVRVIENDCHMFVEVHCNGHWMTCDLGGYPSSLIIQELDEVQNKIKVSPWGSDAPAPTSARQLEFERRLATWCIEVLDADAGLDGVIHELLSCPQSTQLIRLPAHQVLDLIVAIQQHVAEDSAQPVFYIHSPDDLVCSAPFIERLGNRGEFRRVSGGGGALHDFLVQFRDDASIRPLLLVNYTQFAADDFIRFNALIDVGARFADGTPVSPQTRVLGFLDPMRPGAYAGADFYSRFGRVITCPIPIPSHPRPWLVAPDALCLDEVKIINLCHSPAWLRMLVGGWALDADGLVFTPGELVDALSRSRSLVIENPPDDGLFRYFWQQARLRGYIEACGARIPLSVTQCVYVREGYDWSQALSRVCWTTEINECMQVLNPNVLLLFLSRYTITEQQGLMSCPGLIAEHAAQAMHRPLDVFISRHLSDDEWGLFFKELARFPTLSLNMAYAPGVIFPEAFACVMQERASSVLPLHALPTQCIHTDDAEVTLARLLRTDPAIWVLDVSECTAADLLVRISTQVTESGITVSAADRALTQALRAGKAVVLTGSFSDELLDTLAPLLLQRLGNASGVSGRLYLVSEVPFTYVDAVREAIDFSHRIIALKEQGFSEEECGQLVAFQTEQLVTLRTRLRYCRMYPEALTSDEAWAGLAGCKLVSSSLPVFSMVDSAIQADAFIQERLDAVMHVLSHAPYVFLAGLTGVGKSRFVDNELAPYVAQLVCGDSVSSLRAWATAPLSDSDSRWCVLFLDEANLSQKQWSVFEGLFQPSPGVLIDGEYVPLTPRHKVIFAGNPLSYGDRQTASLFRRHGGSLVFQPLSAAVVYVKTIKPLLDGAGLLDATLHVVIATELLAVYNHVIQLSTTEVLISARQIQMITLLILSDYARNPHVNVANLARQHACRIGLDLVPAHHLPDFSCAFPMPSSEYQYAPIQCADFIHTPSREPVMCDLLSFMRLREYQRDVRFSALEKHPLRYGGLNRFIIEGEPGQGKSELLVAVLSALNLSEAPSAVTEQTTGCGNYWYRVSPSMSYPVVRELLLRAFDDGAVVVIDEINCMPSLEGLLNSLLEGIHPDEQHRAPRCPGFKVIGTQNPPTSTGRRIESSALDNRTLKRRVPAYTPAEMYQLLGMKYPALDATTQEQLVSAFGANVRLARQKNLNPPPAFRDLLRLAAVVERELSFEFYLNTFGFFADERGNSDADVLVNSDSVANAFS